MRCGRVARCAYRGTRFCETAYPSIVTVGLEQAGKAWLEFIFHRQCAGAAEYSLDVKPLEALRLCLCANEKRHSQRNTSKADKH